MWDKKAFLYLFVTLNALQTTAAVDVYHPHGIVLRSNTLPFTNQSRSVASTAESPLYNTVSHASTILSTGWRSPSQTSTASGTYHSSTRIPSPTATTFASSSRADSAIITSSSLYLPLSLLPISASFGKDITSIISGSLNATSTSTTNTIRVSSSTFLSTNTITSASWPLSTHTSTLDTTIQTAYTNTSTMSSTAQTTALSATSTSKRSSSSSASTTTTISASSETSPLTSTSDSVSHLSTSTIAGLSAGVSTSIVLLILLGYFFYKRHSRMRPFPESAWLYDPPRTPPIGAAMSERVFHTPASGATRQDLLLNKPLPSLPFTSASRESVGTVAEVGGLYEGRPNLSDDLLEPEDRILTVRNPSGSHDPFMSEASSIGEEAASRRWSFYGGDEVGMIGRAV